jgi:hypothetical protein
MAEKRHGKHRAGHNPGRGISQEEAAQKMEIRARQMEQLAKVMPERRRAAEEK